ncbi:MAG: rhodanese-like domain-containing protein [Kiritimatiellia bacterium]|nr:rhodanese-like domain-containing protein [Kiritimatiellia bacterium]
MRGYNKRWAALFGLLLPGWISCSRVDPGSVQPESAAPYRRIDAAEARRRMVEPGAILLDVRTSGEHQALRIPGSKLIPHTEIRERAPLEIPDHEALILVYCRSGARSARAVRQLLELGYRNVLDFGGIQSWDGEVLRGP